MDRTLFSPAMIDTFRSCPRAFETALRQLDEGGRVRSIASVCKQFVRKGVAEINKGRVTTLNQLQIFIGNHWPVDKMEKYGYDQEQITRAFLYTYKTLAGYVSQPYRPRESEVAAVALKVRARVGSARAYLEDTFDLVLWYPDRAHLEIVDFELSGKVSAGRAWPSASSIARQFLINKLRARFPFRTLAFTTLKLTPRGFQTNSQVAAEDSLSRHFDDLVRDLDAMRAPLKTEAHPRGEFCRYCSALARPESGSESGEHEDDDDSLSLSA